VSSWINDNLANTINPIYLAVLALFIIGFSYFYTAIAFDPVQQLGPERFRRIIAAGPSKAGKKEQKQTCLFHRHTLPHWLSSVPE